MVALANPSIPWERKLLSLTEEVTADHGELLPVSLIVAIAVAVIVVIVIVLCVCGEPSSPELKQVKPRKGPSSMSLDKSAHPPGVTEILRIEEGHEVKVTATIAPKCENGGIDYRNSGANSRSSEASAGSARPPSCRELPELPILDPNRPLSCTENGVSQSIAEDDDDYDHLGKERKSPLPRTNYDHIQLDSPNGDVARISPTDTETPSGENYYAQVPERNYETVSEAKRSKVDPYDKVKDDPYTKVKDDPYTKVKDDPYTKVKDDPYTKVKDDPYTKVKDDPYTKVKDDPYTKVKDDPYTKVKDDPYTKVKDDPYAKVKDDQIEVVKDTHPSVVGITHMVTSEFELDPYSTLDNENTEVKVTAQESSSQGMASLQTSITSATNVINFEDLPAGALGPDFPEPSDEYAVVNKSLLNKSRNASATHEVEEPEELDPYTIPPEPPRQYLEAEAAAQPALTLGAVGEPAQQEDGPEREYTMVTARESLASMTARNALNPYEIVPDTENTYATVEGGSGDGVVQRQEVVPAQAVTDLVSQRLSAAVSETYAEIEGNYATADAPVPPSLDSLHMMTKQQQDDGRRHLASPEDSVISGGSNEYAVVNKRSSTSFSPRATRLPEIPNSPVLPTAAPLVNGMAAEGASNGAATLTVDTTSYQTVKECISYIDENDPNYESVDEAKAKRHSKRDRRHVYEEVSPTNQNAPGFAEASQVRNRVLQSHMYEDIHEIKEQQRKSKRKSGGGDKS